MFEFEYASLCLQKKITNADLPSEVCQELAQFLDALKQNGEVSKADFFLGGIFRISAHTFELTYTVDFVSRIIKILDIKLKSLNLLKERFSITDSWDDKEVLPCIPQFDDTDKIIQALEFINQGIDDAYNLACKLGSKATQKKYVARHGQYAQEGLEGLGLIKRVKKGKKLISELTPKGKLIAEAPDLDTKKRLLIEAMLNYQPIWLILGKVTEGGQKLTDELVLKTIFPVEFQDSKTSPRRAQMLKNWVKWISDYSGIPIHLEDNFLQLTIPMLYAKQQPE